MLVSSVASAPRLMAPSRFSVATGAVSESVAAASAPPNVSVPVESSTVKVPGRTLVPTSPLKVMLPAPARKTRSLNSVPWESIVATSEKKMSPAVPRPVAAPPKPLIVMVRSELIVTAPLIRTLSPSVAMVSVSAAFGPALKVMPVPPIWSPSRLPTPMSSALAPPSPTSSMVVTGPVVPGPAFASDCPKVTPPSASVIRSAPSSPSASAPMFPLKKTDATPASIVSELASVVCESIVEPTVKVTFAPSSKVSASFSSVSKLVFELSVTGPLSLMVSDEVWKEMPVAAPLRMMPAVMTSAAVVPDPMSMAPSVATEVTGPAAPVLAASAAPKVTPAAARSMVRLLMRCVSPMLALKKTAPSPASRNRSLRSSVVPSGAALVPSPESIGESLVKVMSPPLSPVSMLTSDCRMTAPLSRTLSAVVPKAMPVAPPLSTMPPAMTLVDPILMASSVETVLTGPVVPSPGVSVSASPKTTPPSACVMVNDPMVSVLPMSSLKKTAPVPAVIVRLLDSPV